jgi:hypothetical protein
MSVGATLFGAHIDNTGVVNGICWTWKCARVKMRLTVPTSRRASDSSTKDRISKRADSHPAAT